MLTRIEDRWPLLSLFLLCLVTRLYSIPASLWEWDDINFARSLHDYNIPAHSPHPPGFPVFVAMGRIANEMVLDDHLALVAVNLIFAIGLGPILYLLFREILEDRLIAFAAALLSCFAPTLWVHSTIARSDGPTLGMGLISILLILKGRRSSRALLAGCAVLGIGMGVRVTVLMLAAPLLVAVLIPKLRARQFRLVGLCMLTILISVLVWYVPMIVHTGWADYQQALKTQSDYVLRADPIWVPEITLEKRFSSFFLRIWGALWIAHTIYILSALGALCLLKWKRRALGLMVIAFVPYLVFTLIFNTPMGAIVYSMPYLPFFTGLAACGLLVPLKLTARQPVALKYAGLACLVLLTAGFAGWSLPLIKILRSQSSPPVRACEYLMEHTTRDDTVIFEKVFAPHVRYYLPDRQFLQVPDGTADPATPCSLIDPSSQPNRTYVLAAEAPRSIGATKTQHFNWPPTTGLRRLHTLSIGRYFDAWVTDVTHTQNVRLLTSGDSFISQRQIALLALSERMVLYLKADPGQSAGEVKLRMSGRVIERVSVNRSLFEQRVVVTSDQLRFWEVLTIEGVPLRLLELAWEAEPGSKRIVRRHDQFLGEGWFDLESQSPYGSWRWTSATARVHLPPIEGDARLELSVTAPEDNWPLELQVAGTNLRRRTIGTTESLLTYEVPASLHRNTATDLVIITKTKQTGGDPRSLGVRVKYLRWLPAAR